MCRQPLPTIAYPAIDGFVVADNYGCAYDRAAPLFSNISKQTVIALIARMFKVLRSSNRTRFWNMVQRLFR